MLTEIRRQPATLKPSSFDADARTFEAIATTFADVERGPYIERLAPTGFSIPSGSLPILNSHRQTSTGDVIGRADNFRIEDGKLVFRATMSSRPEVAALVADIEAGILRDFSIGYRVSRWAESTESGRRVRTASSFTIHEVSLVPVPADSGATIRNIPMDDDTQALETPATPATQTRAQMNQAIRALAATAGLDADWANGQIDSEATIEAARSAAFEAMAARSVTVRVASPQAEAPEALARNLSEALHARMTGAEPAEQARQYMGHTLADDARALLVARGESVAGLSREAILERAMHTTSDFPNLLTGVGNRTLRAAYEVAQSPLKTLSRQTTSPDFRPINRLQISETGGLTKLTESGEIQNVTRGEAKESYSIETAAAMFSLSRKALINDDLNAFGGWARAAGRQAAEYEAKTLVELMEANPTMQDTKALFHADHGNLAAAASPIVIYDSAGDASLSAISDARLALRTMKGLDGKTPIAVTPKYLLVHPARETEAETALAAIQATATQDVNPFSGKLQVLVEPRLTDESAWYVFCDPAQLACFEHAYLSGAQGPQIATREGWRTLGMEMRVVLDFGAGAVDWRGGYKNAGD
ncbi:prohead protease/major capsid protein fusion protein [Hyphomonas sp. ND6WE1B]|uniref:prohead protease/major capsid protein fusion protein n=1 Tax=Hyphomonas sp. ND6WE1B TaxID=1848191 RepID=UPI00080770BB|nr:prohead protease/major capsid protein fusion protein [Hyphomonas sp. ND6WE1B]